MEGSHHKRTGVWAWCAAAVCLTLWPVLSPAQELDTASQAFAVMRDRLGHTVYGKGLDTTVAASHMITALNGGLRAVQREVPYTTSEVVVIAVQTMRYTLTSFVQPPSGEKSGYRVDHTSDVKGFVRGLMEATSTMMGHPPFTTSPVSSFRVEGDQLIINSCSPPNDTLFVYGPGEITPVHSDTSLITSFPQEEWRWAAVWWAIAELAGDRMDRPDLAGEYKQKFADFVVSKQTPPKEQ